MNRFIRQFGRPSGAVGRFLGKVMSISNKKMYKTIIENSGDFSRLLEIGFGSGAQLEMIVKKYNNKQLYGIDISEDMLRMAENKLAGKAALSVCDCAETQFPDNFFDIVITTDTCYFWNAPAIVLREIKRITVPCGRLVIAVNFIYAASVHRSAGCGMYSDTEIRAELQKAGFRIISQISCGYKQTVYVTETIQEVKNGTV